MGLYDYRPYVKRISNDRQIMFDCDREYRIERGRNILVIKIYFSLKKYVFFHFLSSYLCELFQFHIVKLKKRIFF